MKIITKEEADAHYSATVRGGIIGGIAGLGIGAATIAVVSPRFPTIRHLTLPMKTFLVSSSATFASIISADRASRRFEDARDPQRAYQSKLAQETADRRAHDSPTQKALNFGRTHRFSLITGGWVASMAGSLYMINRSPYLTGSQKLVQARLVAQGVTLVLILASAGLEVGDARKGVGRYEETKFRDESYEGENLWRDMVETEERKMAARRRYEDKKEEDRARRSADGKIKDTNMGQSGNDPRVAKGPSTVQKKGKEGKDKIFDYAQNHGGGKNEHEMEKKKMDVQKKREGDAREEASQNSAANTKVSDRGEF